VEEVLSEQKRDFFTTMGAKLTWKSWLALNLNHSSNYTDLKNEEARFGLKAWRSWRFGVQN
jgi:hypothetical protein